MCRITALIAAVVFVACGSDGPTTGEFGLSHFAVEGTVLNAETGDPVVGASVVARVHDTTCLAAPFTHFELTTGTGGVFEDLFEFLELESASACVTFEVTPPDGTDLQPISVTFPSVTVFRSTFAPDTVRIAILLDAIETLDIFEYTVGIWTSAPKTEINVDIQNNRPSTITNLVVIDTLDAEFGHQIVSENISINAALFPSATVTIGQDGRSFRMELGSLASTHGFVRAFSLTVPTPQDNGVFCNRVLASGFANSEPVTDIEILCFTRTIGN